MEVPITQFRKNIFDLVNQAADGADIWITHKGRRFKVVLENRNHDRLSRITPMDVIASGVDLNDDSWKEQMMRDWELKWDRRLGHSANTPQKPAASPRKKAVHQRSNMRPARGPA